MDDVEGANTVITDDLSETRRRLSSLVRGEKRRTRRRREQRVLWWGEAVRQEVAGPQEKPTKGLLPASHGRGELGDHEAQDVVSDLSQRCGSPSLKLVEAA